MEIKNSQIVYISNNIKDIRQKNLPVKIGFAINKNMVLLEPLGIAYDEERKKILNKYCEKNEDGTFKQENGIFVLKDEVSYEREIRELLDIKNDVSVHKISYEELEKCDNDKYDPLTPNDLSVLEFMIEE